MFLNSQEQKTVWQDVPQPDFEQEVCPLQYEGHHRVQVVGGGFSGTLSVIRLLSVFTEQASKESVLSIEWFDEKGAFFRGLPYRHQTFEEDDGVFILNQPASRMSPFAEDPAHFSRWVEENIPGKDSDSFVSRALYGDYLEDCCHTAIQELRSRGISVNLNLHFQKAEQQLIRDAKPVPCILALGHHERDALSQLTEYQGYISKGFDVQAYREALQHIPVDGDVLIIGAGASMIDSMRALEHCGFQGRYLVVSRNTNLPWEYDPQLYHPDRDRSYRCAYFSQKLYDRQPDFRSLIKILRKEIQHAESLGFGKGHVYAALNVEDIYTSAARDAAGDGLRHFSQHVTFLKGIPTPPENVSLFKSLRAQGRVRFIKGEVQTESVSFDASVGGFRVTVNHRTGSDEYFGDLLVNAARFSKRHELHVARQYHDSFGEPETTLFVGPSSPQEKSLRVTWGVESFRDEVLEVAHQALRLSTL